MGRKAKKKNRIIPFRGAPIVSKPQPEQNTIKLPSNEIVIGDGSPIATTTPRSVRPPAVPRSIAPLGQRELIAKSDNLISINQAKRIEIVADEATIALQTELEKADRIYAEDELQNAWNTFLKAGKITSGQTLAALTSAQLKINNNEMIFSFPSETQVIYFNDIRSDLAGYFKEAFQIKGLTFTADVLKLEEAKVSLLTASQQFEKMRLDNPAIEKLYRLFQLRME
jgi:hypothetical protein